MRRMGLIKRGLTLVLCGMLMAPAAGMAWAPVNVEASSAELPGGVGPVTGSQDSTETQKAKDANNENDNENNNDNNNDKKN